MKIEGEATDMKCKYMHKANHECSVAATLLWALNTKLGVMYLQQHRAWGCVFATSTKQLGLVCNTKKALGCLFEASTELGVVYLQQT